MYISIYHGRDCKVAGDWCLVADGFGDALLLFGVVALASDDAAGC